MSRIVKAITEILSQADLTLPPPVTIFIRIYWFTLPAAVLVLLVLLIVVLKKTSLFARKQERKRNV